MAKPSTKKPAARSSGGSGSAGRAAATGVGNLVFPEKKKVGPKTKPATGGGKRR